MNGLMMKLDIPSNRDDPITVHYNDYSDGGKVGVPKSMEVDLVIGADGANSRVAKDIDAGECDYAIAFQVRPGNPEVDAMHAVSQFLSHTSISCRNKITRNNLIYGWALESCRPLSGLTHP